MSLPLISYVLTAALRDRFVLGLAMALAAALSLSIFLGSAAAMEKNGFALVFAAGGLRAAGVFGLVLFVVFFIRRSFEARDIEMLLSRPIGRTPFLFSYAAAFAAIALGLAVAQALALTLLLPQTGSARQGFILWAVSIAAENIIMVNAALFFAMILSSAATAAMAAAGFYVLARMMGELLGIIRGGSEYNSELMEILQYMMQLISAVMPRLDLMAQSSWLVYGPDPGGPGLAFILAQGFIFSLVLVTAAALDLVRRQF